MLIKGCCTTLKRLLQTMIVYFLAQTVLKKVHLSTQINIAMKMVLSNDLIAGY